MSMSHVNRVAEILQNSPEVPIYIAEKIASIIEWAEEREYKILIGWQK